MEKLAKIFSISTWILLLSFFIFLVKIGFSVCLQTDDFVLLNSYRIHSWTEVYTQFPYNFRLGSYSLFLFLFGEIHPSKVHLFIGFYYLALFLFSVSVFYKTITFFLIYFKQSHFVASDRWKICLYFFLFLFFFTGTVSETWFWVNASFTYYLPFVIALYLSTIVLNEKRSWLQLFQLVVGSFYLGGASEPWMIVWFSFLLLSYFRTPKSRYSILLRVICLGITSLPQWLNVFSGKLTHRIGYENGKNPISENLLYEIPRFVSQFDWMDILAILCLFLLFVEFKVKRWAVSFRLAIKKWLLFLVSLFLLCFLLNVIVFHSVFPIRTYSAFYFLTAIFIFLFGFQFAHKSISIRVSRWMFGLTGIFICCFLLYFTKQIIQSSNHQKAYLNRLTDLSKNQTARNKPCVESLPDAGITVYADFTEDSSDFSNQRYKEYYFIKGNVKTCD